MDLHAHVQQLALESQVAVRIGGGEILAHDAHAHRAHVHAQGQRAQGFHAAPVDVGYVALVFGRAHLVVIGGKRAGERPAFALAPRVGQIEVVRLVQAFDHLEGRQHAAHAVRHRQVGVDLLLAHLDVVRQRLAGHRGEVQHFEFVTQVAQDGFLQFSVIPQAAGACELHQHVGSQLQRLDVVAKDVLEGGAHVVVAVAAAQFHRAPGGLGKGQVVGVEHLLHEELEHDVVVAIAQKGHPRAGMPVALGPALRLGKHQLEGAFLLGRDGDAGTLFHFVGASQKRRERPAGKQPG